MQHRESNRNKSWGDKRNRCNLFLCFHDQVYRQTLTSRAADTGIGLLSPVQFVLPGLPSQSRFLSYAFVLSSNVAHCFYDREKILPAQLNLLTNGCDKTTILTPVYKCITERNKRRARGKKELINIHTRIYRYSQTYVENKK